MSAKNDGLADGYSDARDGVTPMTLARDMPAAAISAPVAAGGAQNPR